jgi:AcrR family transcriptional regulator
VTEPVQGGVPARGRALRAQGRRTVRRLLDAGLAVFDRRGYQAARVDDIVRVAQTSHGTFYLYFANKDDLFRVLAEDCVAAMERLVEDLGTVEPGPAGRAALRRWLTSYIDTYRRYGPVIRAWSEAQVTNRDLARLGARATELLVGRIAERVAARNGSLDPRAAAVAVLAMIERVNYYVLSRNLDVDDAALADTLAAILHAGVFGTPSSSNSRQ